MSSLHHVHHASESSRGTVPFVYGLGGPLQDLAGESAGRSLSRNSEHRQRPGDVVGAATSRAWCLGCDERHAGWRRLLRELNGWSRDHGPAEDIATLVFAETLTTKSLRVVEQANADPTILGVLAPPVDSDHLSTRQVVKPKCAGVTYRRARGVLLSTDSVPSEMAQGEASTRSHSSLPRGSRWSWAFPCRLRETAARRARSSSSE